VTRVLLATRNAGKVVEFRRLLAGSPFEVVGLDGVPPYPEEPETGATFTANALAKARAGAAATGLLAVADDSGLCVDALGGMPGILSARWSGRHGDDAANTGLLLAQLADVPAGQRGASFVCAAAAAAPGGTEVAVLGRMFGSLTDAPRGGGGFGYDPIFLPYDGELTTAELTPRDKDAISHRGRAFRALAPLLPALVG